MFQIRKNVYLDNNATTQPSELVQSRMARSLKENWGNPSSLYRDGYRAGTDLEEARQGVARAIGAEPDEILFTGSASEANNTVLKSLAERFRGSRDTILTSPIEHPSVLGALDWLGKHGVTVEVVHVDRFGRVDLDDLARRMTDRVFLVTVMLANNETGVIQALPAISRIAREHGALVMSDCVQALGKIPVDVKALELDYATFSAHKIHGPKGVGALYVRLDAPVDPLIHGGHQERGLRAGTEGTHNIAGLAAACEELPKLLQKAPSVRCQRDFLLAELRQIKPDVRVNTPLDSAEQALPNTLSVSFPGVENAEFMAMLDSHGISVSAGSACNTPENKASHVLRALGLSESEARNTIRFSLPDSLSQSQLVYTARVIRDYFGGLVRPMGVITPAQLDEKLINHPSTYLLDIRFGYDRKAIPSIPGSYEAGFFNFGRYRHQVPKDRHIVVLCQGGLNAPMIAYHLRSKGYKNVSFVLGGMVAWNLAQKPLFEKLASRPITRLTPRA